MGFHSTLIYYRPRNPPAISGEDLADFVEQLFLRGLTIGGTGVLLLKYGDVIDQDDEPLTHVVPTVVEGVASIEEPEWDIEMYRHPLSDLSRVLRKIDRQVCRAHIGLGTLVPHVADQLGRRNSPDNGAYFRPDSCNLLIGPIETGPDDEYCVGWMAVGLGGNGYLYPWTLRNLVGRAERIPEIQRMMKLCRNTWPVNPEVPERRVQEARQAMKGYWPYDRVDVPWDWYWGLQGLL